MDAMNGREFEEHVAALLRRDGCTDVVVRGGGRDRGVDVTALTADGRRLVVQCKRFAPHLSITSPELQKFVGAAKVLHHSDVALFVATCPFTREALDIAAETGITALHRGLVEQWSAGTPWPSSADRRVGRVPRKEPVRSGEFLRGVRAASTLSTRTSSPHTTYR